MHTKNKAIFRGISKEKKQFIEGSLIRLCDKLFIIADYGPNFLLGMDEVFDKTIGQCVEIIDKNDIYIFEGDKIEFINPFTEKKEISKVFFKKGSFCICLSEVPDFTEKDISLLSFEYKSLKKVGTIYDDFIDTENRFLKIYKKYINKVKKSEL